MKRNLRILGGLAARLFAGGAAIGVNRSRGAVTPISPPLPGVLVAAVRQSDLPIEREWVGTLDGLVNASIKAQVTGYLLRQDYTEGSFVRISSSMVFGFSLLFVFLILAALYESWSLLFSVLLSTPVAVFGALAALWLRRAVVGFILPPYMVQIENDVYSQIGLVMLIGLAATNAILIVEFAKAQYEDGKPLVDAALEGARLRLRPILMTSFAFILGCVPLWTASGAGSVARQIMGTTVIGGMLAASAVGIFLIPAIFYGVEKLSGAKDRTTGAELLLSPAPGD